jgi:hypothetical protein
MIPYIVREYSGAEKGHYPATASPVQYNVHIISISLPEEALLTCPHSPDGGNTFTEVSP